MPNDIRDSRAAPAPCGPRGSEASSLVLAGSGGGIALSLLDTVLAARSGAVLDGATRVHAAALGLLAGIAAGLATAGLAACVRSLARRGLRPAAALLPAALPAAAAFVAANWSLFDGPWVRAQWWAPIGRAASLLLGVAGIALGLRILWAAASWRGVPRLMTALGFALVAVAATDCTLRLFGAYILLKWQFVTVALLAALAACRFVLPRAGLPARPAAAVALLLLAAATAAAVVQRKDPAIHRIRTAILGTPFATTAYLGPLVERGFLDLFGRPAPLGPGAAGDPAAEVPLDPTYDADAILRELETLVPDRQGLNVLLIAIDALRADHLSCEGYPRPTTPRIDALARESAWFRRAVSPIPASSMGYSATMTGLFGRISPAYAAEFRTTFPAPEDLPLAARLRACGRQTSGLTAFYPSVAAQPQFSLLRQGFQRFNETPREEELRAPEVTARALAELDAFRADAPFFLFVHYMDPHAPYAIHEAHDFGNRPRDAYDSEIAFTDLHVGQLLDEIEHRGLLDRTIIVVFGDHGEGFGEHNSREHGANLHDHQVRVPLIVRVPGLPAREIREWVGLPDLAPTLFTLTACPPVHRRLGRDLTPLILGRGEGWPGWAYAERAARADKLPRSWERAVWHADLKLIWKPHHGTVAVYDLAADPGELRNLYDPSDPAHDRLFRLLAAVDRRIDAYWGGEAPESAVLSLEERFAAAVASAARAEDDSARADALAEVVALFDSPGVELRPSEASKLGQASLARLRELLVDRLPMTRHARFRVLAFRALAFLDDPGLDDLLLQELAGEPGGMITEAPLVVARHGRREVLPALVGGYESSFLDVRILCAAGLAHLGDDRGRWLLHAALARSHAGLLSEAIRGLAALGDPAPLLRYLAPERRTWTHPRVKEAVLAAAMCSATPTANAILVRLATTEDDSIAARARAEAERRLGTRGLGRALAIRDAFTGANNALLYHDPVLARRYLPELHASDDPWMGFLWWRVHRIARRAGDPDLARAALPRLAASASELPGVLEFVRAAEEHMAREVTEGSEPRLSVTLDGPLLVPMAAPRETFGAAIAVRNEGPGLIPGSAWPDAPRFFWHVTDAEGREQAPVEAIVQWLPEWGLAPGDSVRLGVLGRLPPKPGSYELRLLWAPSGEAEARPVADPFRVTLP
jgi:arylsulfatase A-like enzyme